MPEEKTAVIDLGGLKESADFAARVALAATLRGWRHDRYRTRLKDKDKASLAEIVIVGADSGASALFDRRWKPVAIRWCDA